MPAPSGRDDRRIGARRMARVFGRFRAPTGVAMLIQRRRRLKPMAAVKAAMRRVSEGHWGRRLNLLLLGKPGLDGHSNGAEADCRARAEVGMDVVL